MNGSKHHGELNQARAQLISSLEQVASGDRAALEAVYRHTSAKLFGICLRICDDRRGAEDVLQDAFVTIWLQAGRFDPSRSSPITWLATITRNKAIDWRRAQRRFISDTMESAHSVPDDALLAFDRMSTRETADRLSFCLDQLEAHSSDAIKHAFLDGVTYSELAQRAAVPLGTMKSWIRRGLQSLKACLGDG